MCSKQALPAAIITISGVAGVGKTTLAKGLLERVADLRMLLSVTTRPARTSDLPGEYRYVTGAEFKALEEDGKLLYPNTVHGNWYALWREDVDRAVSDTTPVLRILTPDGVRWLRSYIPGRVLSLFLIHPEESVLRERMRRRGDTSAEQARRILECREWSKEARKQPQQFHCIEPGSPSQTLSAALEVISRKHR